jgi:hypothetical protein
MKESRLSMLQPTAYSTHPKTKTYSENNVGLTCSVRMWLKSSYMTGEPIAGLFMHLGCIAPMKAGPGQTTLTELRSLGHEKVSANTHLASG